MMLRDCFRLRRSALGKVDMELQRGGTLPQVNVQIGSCGTVLWITVRAEIFCRVREAWFQARGVLCTTSGVEVYKQYLHWAGKSVNLACIGLFGSLGL